jgi:hypothetical protein
LCTYATYHCASDNAPATTSAMYCLSRVGGLWVSLLVGLGRGQTKPSSICNHCARDKSDAPATTKSRPRPRPTANLPGLGGSWLGRRPTCCVCLSKASDNLPLRSVDVYTTRVRGNKWPSFAFHFISDAIAKGAKTNDNAYQV